MTETSWAFGLLVGVSLMWLVTAATSWRGGYLLAAAGVVVTAGVVARRIDGVRPVRVEHGVTTTRGTLDAAGWMAVGGALALMASSQCLFVTFGGWLEDSFDFSPAALSAVTFALGLGELASSVTSARRTDRWGKERSIAGGAALMVPSAAALALWHDSLALGLVLLVLAIAGFEFAIVSSLALASSLVPGSAARGLGMMIGAGTLGRAIASVPATRLFEHGGIRWPATLCAALASVTVLAMLSRSRARTLVA
jgi:predicted MFS family arabinose efflux permease